MTWEADRIAVFVSWVATGLGAGLWVWSMAREKEPIRRMRFADCGVVLLFASILLRIVVQDQSMSILDWAMLVLAPLFIAAALWRLSRTGSPRVGPGEG